MSQWNDGYMTGFNNWKKDSVYVTPQPRHGDWKQAKSMSRRWLDGHATGWHERSKQTVFPGMTDGAGVRGDTSVRVDGAGTTLKILSVDPLPDREHYPFKSEEQ